MVSNLNVADRNDLLSLQYLKMYGKQLFLSFKVEEAYLTRVKLAANVAVGSLISDCLFKGTVHPKT